MSLKKINPKEPVPGQRTGVLILGMHRSGTSALSRVLNLLGCDLPKTLLPSNETNKAGHWESTIVWRLNERILASAGSHWSNWLEFDPSWLVSSKAEEFRKEAVEALQYEYGTSRLFVLKDPRICRLAGFWEDVFKLAGIEPKLILPLRNPLEIAASLEKRNGFVPALSHLLWLRNVLDAENASRGIRRIFTSYDQLLTNWRDVAEKAGATLDIAFPDVSDQVAAKIDAFLSPSYRHHWEPYSGVIENPQVSIWLRDSFAIFDRWASSGECAADFDSLDKIRTEFSRAAPAFSPFLVGIQDALTKTSRRLMEAERICAEYGQSAEAENSNDLATARSNAETENAAALAAAQRKADANKAAAVAATREQAKAELDAAIDATRQEIQAEASSNEKQLRAEVDGLRSVAGAAKQETAAASEKLREAQAAHKTILSSASWRLSAPIRAIQRLPEPIAKLRARRRQRHRERRDYELLKDSDWFDTAWYLKTYPDVAEAGVDPLMHYLRYGAAEGRDPGPQFDTKWYLAINTDVQAASVNPLVHYLRYGQQEGRQFIARDENLTQVIGDQNPGQLLWIINTTDVNTQRYRVHQLVPHLASARWEVSIMKQSDITAVALKNVKIVVLCRIALDDRLAVLLTQFQERGGKVIADIDDMVFDLERIEQLNAYRSRPMMQSEMRAGFAAFRRGLLAADLVTVSTWPLRNEIERLGKRAFVVPNSIVPETIESLLPSGKKHHGAIRICYLSGTPTHDQDFLQCRDALVRVLASHSEVELHIVGHLSEDDLLADRVTRYPLMRHEEMLRLLGGMDINLAPLEINDFTSCKSELKIFEAAAMGVPTVASPSLSYSSCIEHGRTGLLAATHDEWYSAIERLLLDSELRKQIVDEARKEIVPRFLAANVAKILASVLRRAQSNDYSSPLPQSIPAPKVSVVTVLYKKSAEVRHFLEAIRSQDYPGEIEIVLIDDLSPDDSVSRVEDWALWNAYSTSQAAQVSIKIIRNGTNAGNCQSRNYGAKHSTGAILLFADADGVFDHSLISRHVTALTGGFDIAFGHRGIETLGEPPAAVLDAIEADSEEGVKRSRLQDTTNLDSFVNCVTRNLSILRGFYMTSLAGKLFDERLTYSANPDSGFGWEDIELGCRAFKAGARFCFLPDTFALHVTHPVSAHGSDKALRSLRNFRRLHEMHPDLHLLSRSWAKHTRDAIERWAMNQGTDLDENDDYHRLSVVFNGPSSPAIARSPRLRVLTYRWHSPHQYELYRLGHQFDLVRDAGTAICRDWDWAKRPLPGNAKLVSISNINPRDYDLAILHFDENVFYPERCNNIIPEDWGNAFKRFLDLEGPPRIAVCHGTVQFVGQYDSTYIEPDLGQTYKDARKELVHALRDCMVICNSHQSQNEWRFERSRVIWHGFSPTDFPPGKNDGGVLVMPERAMTSRPHYNGLSVYRNVQQHLGSDARINVLAVPDPDGVALMRDNQWARRKYHNYVRALASYGVYFNPTIRSPMPRTRGEAMMAGLVSVSFTSHDVDQFIENGVNGFHSRDPAELADHIKFLTRSESARLAMRERSLKTARDLFNQDRYLSAWAKVIASEVG